MKSPEIVFVVPTHRLREIGQTVECYDDNFWRNGHAVPTIVFDDSSIVNQAKYYSLLERTKTHNELFYVGPKEKEQFIHYVCGRLRDSKLTPLVRNTFRPSYGGNRNFTLAYTLGNLMVSADDDMRPYALIEGNHNSLSDDEVCRGHLVRAENAADISERSFDIIGSFQDVLGKKAAEVPDNFAKGETVVDSAMDLETNASKGLARENSLYLKRGKVSRNGTVKMAQTFRSGTNDIDALDFAEIFLEDEDETSLDALNDLYVLVNFRPVVTNKNWRMDCGVAGYDNTLGLPPFFPTRLRFEDYIFRIWVLQDGVLAAHVDAAQHHTKNGYMRNPLAAEVFNEEVANLLKRKIKDSVRRINDLSISFDYDGEVSATDTSEILDKVRALHARFIQCGKKAINDDRRSAMGMFAVNLEKAFYGFEPDFFQENVSRIVDDVVTQFQSALELWPSLLEICYFQKQRKGLPMTRIKNSRRNGELQ
jgi:hypothetical protein